MVKKMQACTAVCILALLALTSQVHALLGLDLSGLLPGVGGPLPVVGGPLPGGAGGPKLPVVGGLIPDLGGLIPGIGGTPLPVTGGLVPGVNVPQPLNCDLLKINRCINTILQAQTSGVVNVPLQTCCATVLPCFCNLGSDLRQQLISSAAGQPLAAACGASTPTCT